MVLRPTRLATYHLGVAGCDASFRVGNVFIDREVDGFADPVDLL